MIALTPGDIHLWLTYYDEIGDEQLRAAYRALLTEEERAQELRFHFAKDQRCYLATRALVRTVLSQYASVPPQRWRFSKNAYGRPQIADPSADAADLSFNISHTRGLIVLGVTRRRALGVDVENIVTGKAAIEIAPRFFAPEEIAALTALPETEQSYRFFEYWTFKESYIKSRGLGLALPLEKFCFHCPHAHTVELSIHPELGDDAARWQFWQLQPSPEFLIAVSAERVRTGSVSPIVRRAVPLVSEEPLAVTFLRTSR